MLTNKSLTKILELFQSRKSFHVREVARQTGLNQNSVVHFLKILEKESILKSWKDANLKKYTIQNNKKAYAILTLLDTEKLERLSLSKKSAIDAYINSLPPLVFAVLYDNTLLLVTYDNTHKVHRMSKAFSIVQISYNDFIKELRWKDNKIVQTAIETGLPIINHIRYYETILLLQGR